MDLHLYITVLSLRMNLYFSQTTFFWPHGSRIAKQKGVNWKPYPILDWSNNQKWPIKARCCGVSASSTASRETTAGGKKDLASWAGSRSCDLSQFNFDIFKLSTSLEKSSHVTIITTKLKVWLYQNSFAKLQVTSSISMHSIHWQSVFMTRDYGGRVCNKHRTKLFCKYIEPLSLEWVLLIKKQYLGVWRILVKLGSIGKRSPGHNNIHSSLLGGKQVCISLLL